MHQEAKECQRLGAHARSRERREGFAPRERLESTDPLTPRLQTSSSGIVRQQTPVVLSASVFVRYLDSPRKLTHWLPMGILTKTSMWFVEKTILQSRTLSGLGHFPGWLLNWLRWFHKLPRTGHQMLWRLCAPPRFSAGNLWWLKSKGHEDVKAGAAQVPTSRTCQREGVSSGTERYRQENLKRCSPVSGVVEDDESEGPRNSGNTAALEFTFSRLNELSKHIGFSINPRSQVS